MGILDDILEALGIVKKKEPAAKPQAAPPQAAAPEPESDDEDDEPTEEQTLVSDDDDDDDDDDDESWDRDYDLEDRDDFASFDARGDLKGWFVANRRIEEVWEDKEQRRVILGEYGIRGEPHYYQVVATFERFVQSPEAASIYGPPDAIMQLQLNAATDSMAHTHQQQVQEMSAELEPVEGLSLEHWAWGAATLAQGGTVDQVLQQLQIDQAKWDRVSAEWNARMSRDTTATIATEYSKYFSGSAGGQFADAGQQAAAAMGQAGAEVGGDEPYPFEKWIEITVAMDKRTELGEDPAQILASFGMTAAEWGVSGGWWSQKFHAHAYDQQMLERYNQLTAHYETQYANADPDSDVEF